ncbi:hypothetical protein Nepgr_001038 [Nepenthes gracilis]|uniref:Uncharacterized protein n=1 Tax=Nepenthes gracilis TaxID=150966 RepID=A0AAD3P7I9_NEPGR|nr:hypothetical protein Nepgr_001038 [Nepenthes gracilis]
MAGSSGCWFPLPSPKTPSPLNSPLPLAQHPLLLANPLSPYPLHFLCLQATSDSVPLSPTTFNVGPASEFLLEDESKQEDVTILIASNLPNLGLRALPANPPTAPSPSPADFGGPPSRLGNMVPLRELANVRQSHTKEAASMKGHSNSFATLQSVDATGSFVPTKVFGQEDPSSVIANATRTLETPKYNPNILDRGDDTLVPVH